MDRYKLLQYSFATLAKRLKFYFEYDAKTIQQFLERLHELEKQDKKLRTLSTLLTKLYKSFLSLSDSIYKTFKDHKGRLPKNLIDIYDYTHKITFLKANSYRILKNLKFYGISSEIVDTNEKIAKVLTYQDLVRYSVLKPNELDQLISRYRAFLKEFRKEIQSLHSSIKIIVQELERQLAASPEGRKYLKTEAFEVIKRVIRKTLDRIMNFFYRIYKSIASFLLKIDNMIQSRIERSFNIIIDKIVGQNHLIRGLVTGILAGAALPWLKSRISYSFLAFAGPLSIYFSIMRTVLMIAKAETSGYETLSNFLQVVRSLEETLSELDKDLEELLA
jgi:hypothetical protein